MILRFDELRFSHYTDDEGGAMSGKLLLRMCLKIISLGVFVWKGNSKNRSEALGFGSLG